MILPHQVGVDGSDGRVEKFRNPAGEESDSQKAEGDDDQSDFFGPIRIGKFFELFEAEIVSVLLISAMHLNLSSGIQYSLMNVGCV